MAKNHPERFLSLVDEARGRITEWTIHEVHKKMDDGTQFHLVDVREDREYAAGRIPGAVHLGKGVIERDIERAIPDTSATIVLYCGGGYRSALAADNLQKMGYENVISMDGGIGGWRQAGYPLDM